MVIISGCLAAGSGGEGLPPPSREDARSTSDIDAHVGRRIRERREAVGLSRQALARKLGLTFSQVQKYEKGANRIGAGRLLLIADALRVPVAYFFGGLVGASPPDAGPRGQAPGLEPDAAVLVEALHSISDPEARQALIALASAMAAGDREKGSGPV